jgi:hypothetical protein
MKSKPAGILFYLIFGVLFILLTAGCSPKFIVQGRRVEGRVLDDKTGYPLEGAAVAIRWLFLEDRRDSNRSFTFHAAQEISGKDGIFHIPCFPNRNYVMGVYKQGYVCWSSRESFFENENIKGNQKSYGGTSPALENGIEIRLKPFEAQYSRKRHAGFTLLVAGECTVNSSGPFNRAIESEYNLWRNNLRNGYRQIFGGK